MASLLMHHRRRKPAGEEVPPSPPNDLLGVGSPSTSLTLFPPIANTTAGDWYVDSDREDSGDGKSIGTAFRTLQEGLNALQDGETLLVRGTHSLTSQISRNTGWDTTTRVMGYGSELPVLSFSGYSGSGPCINFGSSSRRELWHRFYIRDHTIQGTQGTIRVIDASDTVLSRIYISHCQNQGIWLTRANGTHILDGRIWRLGDGESVNTNTPDGIAVSDTSTGIVVARTLVANATDDGIDFWLGNGSYIRDCAILGCGYYWNGIQGGDGNGVKLGGGSGSGSNYVLGSLVVGSFLRGFDRNFSNSNTFTSNTATDNGWTGFVIGNGTAHDNISYQNGETYEGGSGSVSHNSWQLGGGNPRFASTGDGDFSLAGNSPYLSAGFVGDNLGASEVALSIAKEWWNHKDIYLPGRGAGSGGTGLPGDPA